MVNCASQQSHLEIIASRLPNRSKQSTCDLIDKFISEVKIVHDLSFELSVC